MNVGYTNRRQEEADGRQHAAGTTIAARTSPRSCCAARCSTPRPPPRSRCGSHGLALAETLTVVFHGRARPRARSRPTSPTAATARASGSARATCCACPCDLDLGDAARRDEAEEAYAEQARTLRDALQAADTVLAVWREPLRGRRRVATSRVDCARSTSTSRCPPTA